MLWLGCEPVQSCNYYLAEQQQIALLTEAACDLHVFAGTQLSGKCTASVPRKLRIVDRVGRGDHCVIWATAYILLYWVIICILLCGSAIHSRLVQQAAMKLSFQKLWSWAGVHPTGSQALGTARDSKGISAQARGKQFMDHGPLYTVVTKQTPISP